MENWEKAINLKEFINFYVPNGYREPIGKFDYIPSITEADYVFFEYAYKDQDLPKRCKTYKRHIFNETIFPFSKHYIIEAIKAYFDKESNEDLKFVYLYEKSIKEGEKRFGSDCPHAETKDGVCLKCLRKVKDSLS